MKITVRSPKPDMVKVDSLKDGTYYECDGELFVTMCGGSLNLNTGNWYRLTLQDQMTYVTLVDNIEISYKYKEKTL